MVLCCKCEGIVYPAEEVQYQGKIYHRPCFKCTHCEKKLSLATARSFNKTPYCGYHSPTTTRIPAATSTNEPDNIPVIQPNNIVIDKDPIPSIINPPPQNNIISPSPSSLNDRTGVLATGYDVFQAQIELAGQVFTIDPVVRQNIFDMFNEFNIIVCGSARVGKSTLINAICGRPFAKTSPGLDSCTKDIGRYVLNEKCRVDNELITYTYNFWDTPGFESWNEKDIQTNFNKIIQKPKSHPICMIYCASPGSFADTQQLKWLLDICIREHKLLCALVVTNKWAGQKEQRLAVINKYKELLANYHAQTSEEDGVIYFGNVALCTMINAHPYIDEDQDINRGEEGVDELIEGIMTCLDDDARVFHWCMAVMQKKGLLNNFKGRMKQRYDNFTNFITKRFTKTKNHQTN